MSRLEARPLLASSREPEEDTISQALGSNRIRQVRSKTLAFLASAYGHYTVLFMVAVDTIGIFATFLIELYLCEHECCKVTSEYSTLHDTQNALETISLVFSCLFLLELCACIFAFGFKYFKSWFHCLDASVIIIAFVIDAFLQGILEEVGSAVVILRFWRVFKIMDEFSAGAKEQMEILSERLEELEKENAILRSATAGSTHLSRTNEDQERSLTC